MATLYISYFGSVEKLVAGDPIKSETVTTSTTSATSATIPANAVVATIFSDTQHAVTIGSGTPVAAVGAGSFYLHPNVPRDLIVTRSYGAFKIAAVTA